jgi:hypothetical protein
VTFATISLVKHLNGLQFQPLSHTIDMKIWEIKQVWLYKNLKKLD